MPLYDFENKKTGEIEEHMVKLADYDQFLIDNPDLKRIISPVGIDFDGSKSMLQRAGDGWKEVQSRIKSGLPPRLRDNIKTK
jgi:predicted nucleic acid-binding Zn ribbon protein